MTKKNTAVEVDWINVGTFVEKVHEKSMRNH